ncbi:head-tail connector protein [Klebsiella pneumoniae]|uniref:head-tail connector protein n=1 Tax=Klebsiella pneumoniae TaxID=573 RepID=UPI000DE5EE5A|nr:head-tail connector protein [Klebsiella pneumoniae]EKW9879517.1 phage head-tail connector protein [Klebsiella pneumoniae]EMC2811228.1 phage head-tail connector protein [Klebsiella pneumoniae]SSL20693.1 Phage gp6-like head-tail connector protein [Klebsiella pneumoniae]HCI5638342.1 phage head-tail connector protein [Klebsiella pneumoniae]
MTINALDVVSIEELRQHIEFDSDDRDALIARYAQGALDYCLTYCDEPRWKQPDDLPSQVVSAMLVFFCDAFEHRGAQTETQLYANQRAHDLLFQVRNWRGETDVVEGV